MTKRIRYTKELLLKFCYDNNIILLNDCTVENINARTLINGQCITQYCENNFDKTFMNLYEINGYCKSCISKKRLEKYKATCFKKYGVENPFQSEDVKDKSKSTWLKKYGVEHPSKCKEIKLKKVNTCLDMYGVEYQFQSEDIKDKSKSTWLKKYGVENPCQNSNIFEKRLKSSYSKKNYTLPSGKIVSVQGYEPYALDELVKINNEDDIKVGAANVPEIWYNDEIGKKHRYYVDVFILSQNKCIEVKGINLMKLDKNTIFIKQKAVKDAGYICEIWVYNSKGEKVECHT
jgi:hypothetical protein